MSKQFVAFLAAFLITGVIALSMFAVGANALLNPNGVPVSNSPAQAAAASADPTSSSSAQAQIAQLQSQVAQYQAALQNDNQMLSQASQELQNVQQLLLYLQSRGLIQIDSQGNITVP
jgi:acyl-CoA synthetase (NDP forming)